MPRPEKHPALVSLGRAIRNRRERLGISQEELAARCKMHRTYIGGIERGERNASVISLTTISAALDRKISKLMTDAGL